MLSILRPDLHLAYAYIHRRKVEYQTETKALPICLFSGILYYNLFNLLSV